MSKEQTNSKDDNYREEDSPIYGLPGRSVTAELVNTDYEEVKQNFKHLTYMLYRTPEYFMRGANLLKDLHERVKTLSVREMWHHFSVADPDTCEHCTPKTFYKTPEEKERIQEECLQEPWMCACRDYILSSPEDKDMEVPAHLMKVSEYLNKAKHLLRSNNLPKGYKFLTQFNSEVVKKQPHLKSVCDSLENNIFHNSYALCFARDNDKLEMPAIGKETVGIEAMESTPLRRQTPSWRSILPESAEEEEDSDEEDIGDGSPFSDFNLDKFVGLSLAVEDKQVKLFFSERYPCAYCKFQDKYLRTWTNCTGCVKNDQAKHHLGKEQLAMFKDPKKVFFTLGECQKLYGYQHILNSIFACYDINRSIQIMCWFHKHLLHFQPHLKKYIRIYEGVVHRSWGGLRYIDRGVVHMNKKDKVNVSKEEFPNMF